MQCYSKRSYKPSTTVNYDAILPPNFPVSNTASVIIYNRRVLKILSNGLFEETHDWDVVSLNITYVFYVNFSGFFKDWK